MFVITLNGKENQGVYSVTDDYGEQIVYLFEEEDDAVRYAMMLEEEDYPEMHVIEIEDKIKAIEELAYYYDVNFFNLVLSKTSFRKYRRS